MSTQNTEVLAPTHTHLSRAHAHTRIAAGGRPFPGLHTSRISLHAPVAHAAAHNISAEAKQAYLLLLSCSFCPVATAVYSLSFSLLDARLRTSLLLPSPLLCSSTARLYASRFVPSSSSRPVRFPHPRSWRLSLIDTCSFTRTGRVTRLLLRIEDLRRDR